MAGQRRRAAPPARTAFWTWRQLMFRFLDRMTPDDVQAIAAFAQMQMLEAGGTPPSAEFHYLHHGPARRAHTTTRPRWRRALLPPPIAGFGMTLLPVLYQRRPRRAGAGSRAGAVRQRRRRLRAAGHAAARRWRATRRRGDGHRAAFSLRAVTDDGLQAAAAGRRRPLHMHLAEQEAEVAEVEAAPARARSRTSRARARRARWCLSTAPRPPRRDPTRIAATGAVAGLCPITEASLGDGIFDAWLSPAPAGAWGCRHRQQHPHIADRRNADAGIRATPARPRPRRCWPMPIASTGRRILDIRRGGRRAGRRARQRHHRQGRIGRPAGARRSAPPT